MRYFAFEAIVAIMLALGASSVRADALPPGESAAGYYNIANSFARAGKPGLAVVNYERARLLAPDDPDIEANLRLVQAAAHVSTELPSVFERAVRLPNSVLMAWFGVSGLILIGSSGLTGFFFSSRRRFRAATALVGALLMAATAANAMAVWPALHAAVVINDATPARVTPAPMGDPAFVLPEAETVRVAAEHEDFVLVRTRAGRTGWVARNALAWVIPVN